MAETIVGKTGDDVEMGMGDDLASGAIVVHYYIYPVGINTLFYSNGYFFDK